MTDVFIDSWAWLELYTETAAGKRLSASYAEGSADVHTSIWALAEVGAITHWKHGDPLATEVVARIEQDAAEVHPVTLADARAAPGLRTVLRQASGTKASLADAVMLCQARRLRMPLISGDGGFAGQPDVRPE